MMLIRIIVKLGWLSISAFRNVPRFIAYETPRVTSHFAPDYYVDVPERIRVQMGRFEMSFVSETETLFIL
jgi:hypothetical protein